jgi:hypothetical protein
MLSIHEPPETIRRELSAICGKAGVTAPHEDIRDLPAIRRMMCPMWWRRRIVRAMCRAIETRAITDHRIGRGRELYASNRGVALHKYQTDQSKAAMADALLVNIDSGESFRLAEIAEHMLANPAVRRAEMMVRIKGLQELAKERGEEAAFWTLTAPSAYHSMTVKKDVSGGEISVPNNNWKHFTPRQAQEWLCKIWARARAGWAREGLDVSGIRVAEPHHDGCPHWHILVFGKADDLEQAGAILQARALAEYADEYNATEIRFKSIHINPARGDALGYIALYVSKQIDETTARDPENDDASDEGDSTMAAAIKRVRAWASVWRIRQFQFFGAMKATLWRLLRSLNTAADSPAIEEARIAADAGDMATATRAVEKAGGIEFERVGEATEGKYGDLIPVAISALIAGIGERVAITARNWQIMWGAAREAGPATWTRVNNCTG